MPPIHDACIVGLRLQADDQVVVSFCTDSVVSDLLFAGVEVFHASAFQTQNIAFELLESSGDAVNCDQAFEYLETRGSVNRDSVHAKEIVERLKRGELHLFELVSSLGCWFVCIAESGTWMER